MPSLSQIYFGKQEIFKNWYEMFVLNIIQKVLQICLKWLLIIKET